MTADRRKYSEVSANVRRRGGSSFSADASLLSQWLGMHFDARSLGIHPNGAVGSLITVTVFTLPKARVVPVVSSAMASPCNWGLMRHVDFGFRARRRLGIPTRLIIEFVRDPLSFKKKTLIHYHSCVLGAAVPRPCTGIWMLQS